MPNLVHFAQTMTDRCLRSKSISDSKCFISAAHYAMFSFVFQVFNEEIFGEVADEKEVEGIVNKVFEARSSKSYDSYTLMAKFIAKHSLINFMKPLKQVGLVTILLFISFKFVKGFLAITFLLAHLSYA